MVIINDDGNETVIHRYPIDLVDVEQIESYLRGRDCFCASFLDADPYMTALYLDQACRHQTETTFVLDRNIFSEVLTLVHGGTVTIKRPLAAYVMAFVQCAEATLSASLAIYEGQSSGVSAGWEDELDQFDKALTVETENWTDIALGRTSAVLLNKTRINEPVDRPSELIPPQTIRPYSFIYPAVLRIAQLQRLGGRKAHRMSMFLRWSFDEWRFSAAATLFAMQTFSDSPARGAFKKINNRDRIKALHGARNAAWDLAHLTALFEAIVAQESERRLTVFCSADREVVRLGKWLLSGMYGEDNVSDFMTRHFGEDINRMYWKMNARRDDRRRLVNVHSKDWKSYQSTLVASLEEAFLDEGSSLDI
jgi:hypothetical protein